jgi:hypothetical protein
MINIHDPVAGVSYMLNDREKTAQKMKLLTLEWMRHQSGGTEDVLVERQVAVAAAPGVPVPPPPTFAAGHVMARRSSRNARTESLGKQNIEGLVCDGTRVTHTIAAGEIGNDRPIETVTERWHSPELQTLVMTRTSDPMSGETVYRLTNVRRSEPDKALFEIPAGYTIKEGGEFERVIETGPRQ